MTRTSDADPSEGLGARAMVELNNVIGCTLREKYLDPLNRQRDDLLRPQYPDDSGTTRYLRAKQLRVVEETWDSLIRTLQSELPRMLDTLLNELQEEFRKAGNSTTRLQYTAPLTPPTTSKELTQTTNQIIDPIRAPASFMPTRPIVNDREHSVTPPIFADIENDQEPATITCPGVTEAGSPVSHPPACPSMKRPSNSEEASSNPKKKAKRTPQTRRPNANEAPTKEPVSLRDCQVDKGECIYRYGDHPGYYNLRCNASRCKNRLGRDEPIYFTSHPFRNGLAMEHFGGEGHAIKTEKEIFRKYARKVIDAKREYNVEKIKGQGVPGSIIVPSKPNLASPPKSPSISRDKGKQPERVINLNQPWTTAGEKKHTKASTSTSTSKFQYIKDNIVEQYLDSSYKPPDSIASSSCGQSDNDRLATLSQDSLSVNQSEENLRYNSRGILMPDYKEKPPTDEEFQDWQQR
ncbi:hypothetical protein F5Y19DRAFT_419934 [Xylariaceae sp. FL1651]|nr:hypothetical protein F5Y19DRAFT_419934 [Xylariaceae sp. FL1651]